MEAIGDSYSGYGDAVPPQNSRLRDELITSIRQAMSRQGISEEELSSRTEISLPYLRRSILSGGAINIKTLERIAAALELRAVVRLVKRAA